MGFKKIYFVLFLLVFVVMLCFNGVCSEKSDAEAEKDACAVEEAEESHKNKTMREADASAGSLWCESQEMYRKGKDRDCCDKEMIFDERNLISFLSVFAMITYGAFVRSILKATGLPVPYTVILMVSGLAVGFASKEFCHEMEFYTAVSRTPPKVILYLFLPVLIFESAFSIPVHTFMRSAGQILVAAFPGMVIATFATAAICLGFLSEYKWGFQEAALFGSIVSATDPVAVVAILRDLGTSELLSVMIEGESLLNDGVAILFYEIFEKIILKEAGTGWVLFGTVMKLFCIIALGGPFFGWIMAKIAIFCLSRIFNDETVEVTITLVAAYLTYFIGDYILGVSGVMAVVVLGLTMSAEKTCISPEVEHAVHHFWEMLGYLANTVLFVFVGIIIAESALNNIEWHDVYYLLFLYVALNIVRFSMLLMLSPILSRIGYGLKWENMIIIMWGGLRGAVGLCLALEVYSGELCEESPRIGPSFLFQTAGIVVLTLLVNGTTTKKLLEILRLTEISIGRLQDMASAHKALVASQIRTINTLKHDRFFADSNWSVVVEFTSIINPYVKHADAAVHVVEHIPSIISLKLEETDHKTECPECHTQVENEPTVEEKKVLTEEARCRLIKALKVSFWKQFERGILLEVSTQILSGIADEFEDRELRMIHAEDLQKYWNMHGIFAWIRNNALRAVNSFHSEPYLRKPANKCRRPFWWLATRVWFDGIVLFVILINLIPIIWELVLFLQEAKDNHERQFFFVNIAFFAFYMMEFLVKIIGRGAKEYFTNAWNYIDFLVLIIGLVEILLRSFLDDKDSNPTIIHNTLNAMRGFRVIRIIRLPRYILPKLRGFIERRINHQLFLGYDIAKGFVFAIDEVIKHISFVSDSKKIVHKLKHNLEIQRLETIREMGFLQRENPGIAIAVKTRHASRAVLNQMRDHLAELNEDGLVDEKENLLLTSIIEESMKKLWHSPSSIPPSSPEVHLANLSWCSGDDRLVDFVYSNATLLNFNVGDTICELGDEPDGIYLIVSGLVKIHYDPDPQFVKECVKMGKLPNMEVYLDLSFQNKTEDFFSTGTILGEWGILTGQPRAATVLCETPVLAYFINKEAIKEAFTLFVGKHDSLESKMWRSCGMRLGTSVISHHPTYKQWTSGRIRLHLERSVVPVETEYENLKLPAFVSDVILLQGQITNYHKKSETFTAPCLLPRSCVRIMSSQKSIVPPRILIVAFEDIDEELISASAESLYDYISKATTKALPKEAVAATGRERRFSINGVRHNAVKLKAPPNQCTSNVNASLTFQGRKVSLSTQNTGRRASLRPGRRGTVVPLPLPEGQSTDILHLPKMNVNPRHHHNPSRIVKSHS